MFSCARLIAWNHDKIHHLLLVIPGLTLNDQHRKPSSPKHENVRPSLFIWIFPMKTHPSVTKPNIDQSWNVAPAYHSHLLIIFPPFPPPSVAPNPVACINQSLSPSRHLHSFRFVSFPLLSSPLPPILSLCLTVIHIILSFPNKIVVIAAHPDKGGKKRLRQKEWKEREYKTHTHPQQTSRS